MPLGGLIIGGVAGATQLGVGIVDKIKGKREYDKAQSFFEKNKFAIPESAKASLNNAQRQASGLTLPGEDITRARMQEATSGAVGSAQNAATSSADLLSVLGNVYGQQQQGEQDLMYQGAQRYDRNQDMLRGEMNRMADWEQQKWQYNSLMPYQQMLGRAAAFSDRGSEGIGMGLKALGQTGANYSMVKGAESSQADFMKLMGLV